MKKCILILLTFVMSLCLAKFALAAGTCTFTGYNYGYTIQRYDYTCTAHTDASLSATLAADAMDGKTCIKLESRPGGTAPTDATELTMTTSRGKSLIAAAGHGLNFIDATTENWTYFEGPAADGNSDAYYEPMKDDDITVAFTNNAVNSAITLLSFYCYP